MCTFPYCPAPTVISPPMTNDLGSPTRTWNSFLAVKNRPIHNPTNDFWRATFSPGLMLVSGGSKFTGGVLTFTRRPDHWPRDPVLRGRSTPSGSLQWLFMSSLTNDNLRIIKSDVVNEGGGRQKNWSSLFTVLRQIWIKRVAQPVFRFLKLKYSTAIYLVTSPPTLTDEDFFTCSGHLRRI